MINSVYLEITTACNLNCHYCYNKCESVSLCELPIIEIKKVIDYCRREKVDIIISGGEPFLYRAINELLSIIKAEKDVFFHIVTNGVLVDFQKIKKIKNLCLHISLDSQDPILNAYTRGEYMHYRVLELIRQLGENKRPFYVNMVIAKKNINGIEAFFKYVIENNGIPQFSFVQYQASAIKNWSALSLSTKEKYFCWQLIHRLNAKNKIQSNSVGCFSMCPIITKYSKINIAIDVLGRIFPCQSLRNEALSLGNVTELSDLCDLYSEIIAMQDRMSKRKTMNYGCDACYLANICYRGCISDANNLYNDLFENDGNCELRRWQYLFLLKGSKDEI